MPMFLVVGWRDISARAREEELKMTEVSRHVSIAGWWYVPPSRQPENLSFSLSPSLFLSLSLSSNDWQHLVFFASFAY